MGELNRNRSCECFESFTDEYIDNELTARTRAEYEEHIAVCAECRAMLDARLSLCKMVRESKYTPERSIASSVMEIIKTERRQIARPVQRFAKKRYFPFATVAAAAAVLIIFIASRDIALFTEQNLNTAFPETPETSYDYSGTSIIAAPESESLITPFGDIGIDFDVESESGGVMAAGEALPIPMIPRESNRAEVQNTEFWDSSNISASDTTPQRGAGFPEPGFTTTVDYLTDRYDPQAVISPGLPAQTVPERTMPPQTIPERTLPERTIPPGTVATTTVPRGTVPAPPFTSTPETGNAGVNGGWMTPDYPMDWPVVHETSTPPVTSNQQFDESENSWVFDFFQESYVEDLLSFARDKARRVIEITYGESLTLTNIAIRIIAISESEAYIEAFYLGNYSSPENREIFINNRLRFFVHHEYGIFEVVFEPPI